MAIKLKKEAATALIHSAVLAHFMPANRDIPELIREKTGALFKDRKDDEIIDISEVDGDKLIKECTDEVIKQFQKIK